MTIGQTIVAREGLDAAGVRIFPLTETLNPNH